MRDGRAGFMLEVPASAAAAYGPVREEAEAVLAGLPGVERAQVVLTTALQDSATTRVRKARQARRRTRRPSSRPPSRPRSPRM